jgi:uncharacterized protein
VTAGVLAAAALAVFLGALVQSATGFGLGLLAAPLLSLLDPAVMPGGLLIVTATLPVLSMLNERRYIDWHGFGWAIAGRAIGTVGGIWVLAHLPLRGLQVGVGLMVLAVVLVSVRKVRARTSRVTLVAAGVVSGVTGTATAIGGPPVALAYQEAAGPRIRATLAAFFFAGTVLSLTSLVLAGQLHRHAVVGGLELIPFMVAGFALSGPLRHYLDKGRIRTAVLTLAAASAVVLVVRGFA